jgi:hypothetical protein
MQNSLYGRERLRGPRQADDGGAVDDAAAPAAMGDLVAGNGSEARVGSLNSMLIEFGRMMMRSPERSITTPAATNLKPFLRAVLSARQGLLDLADRLLYLRRNLKYPRPPFPSGLGRIRAGSLRFLRQLHLSVLGDKAIRPYAKRQTPRRPRLPARAER